MPIDFEVPVSVQHLVMDRRPSIKVSPITEVVAYGVLQLYSAVAPYVGRYFC